MKNEDVFGPLRDELIDISFRQEEILTELVNLVNSTDKNKQVLSALETCSESLANLEESYKQLITEFEKAAYSQAVHHFNL